MGNFNIQNYMITFLLVIGVLITFSGAAVSMNNKYSAVSGTTIDTTNFNRTYDQLDEIQDETEDLEDRLIGGGTGDQDADTTFLGEALSSVKIVFQSFGATKTMVQETIDTFKIPQIWYRIFMLMLVIMIATTIVFMIFKHKGD